jgi:transmembrane sensor
MEENEYILLILKHLNKEATPDEQAGLRQWLEADPDHRREYQALEDIWTESGQALRRKQFDTEAAWKKVEARTAPLPGEMPLPGESLPLPAGTVRRFPWKKMLAAASVLLLLGASGWWYGARKAAGLFHSVTASDGPMHLSLPDGSMVDLRKGAALQYQGSFNSVDRQVELRGEAFFQVTHDPAKPFSIRTAHAILEDMGTSFLVRDGKDSDEVIVETGKVKFTDRDDPSHSIILLSGRSAALTENQFTQSTAANRSFMSWKTGVLDFRDELLEQAVEEIGSFYQVPVSVSPDLRPDAGKITITARFDRQSLEEVIEEVRLMTKLTIKREKDVLVFSR